jgi:hypothetical protein
MSSSIKKELMKSDGDSQTLKIPNLMKSAPLYTNVPKKKYRHPNRLE